MRIRSTFLQTDRLSAFVPCSCIHYITSVNPLRILKRSHKGVILCLGLFLSNHIVAGFSVLVHLFPIGTNLTIWPIPHWMLPVACACFKEELLCLKPDMVSKGILLTTAMMKEAVNHYTVLICIHLDHATTMKDIKEAIGCGFTSVMYDGSVLPVEENAANTKTVVDHAHTHGISVEAELGHVGDGIAGDNDGSAEDDTKSDHTENSPTNPDDAVRLL